MQYITSAHVHPLYKVWPLFLDEMDLSLNAKKVYVDLLYRSSASQRNGNKWMDAEGHVFIRCSIAEVGKMIGKQDTAAKACIKELREAGLIDCKRNQAASNTIYVGYPDGEKLFDSQSVGKTTDRNFTQSEIRPTEPSDSRNFDPQIVGNPTVSIKSKEYRVKDSATASPTPKKFKRPDLEEAKAYFAEKGSTDTEAENFMDHFDSNGWKVGGKAPMKDWKAAARKWIRTEAEWTQQKTPARPAGRPREDW